jgi:tetratricopeptide (TPR) repeat protein
LNTTTPDEIWRESHVAFRGRDYARCAELTQALLDSGLEGIDEAAVRMQFGVALLRLRRPEDGVRELQRVVALRPDDGRAHYKLGIGLARLRRSAEALAALRRGVELAPQVADHQWRLAEELRRQGHRTEALAHVQAALKLDPAHRESQETLKALRGSGWLGWLRRPGKS